MVTVELPWPARPLWQNYRGKRRVEIAARKKARDDAFFLAKAAKVKPDPHAVLRFAFHPPDRRRRDAQNMPATMKSQIDGIALAMKVDDAGFRCVWPVEFEDPIPGGLVRVTIGGEL